GDPNCGWVPTVEYSGVAGFIELGELYTCLPGAGLVDLVKASLEADHRSALGDENAKVVFINSKLGRAYEYDDDCEDADGLLKRSQEDEESQHEELHCPQAGLLVTCGIDVQDDRVEVIIRAWGKGEET